MLVAAERVVMHNPHGTRMTRGAVRLEEGRIAQVIEGRVPDADVVLPDGFLAPGLIDLQVNGYYGVDFVDAEPEGWRRVINRLPETGVTSCLPTFISAPIPVLADALRRTAVMLSSDLRGEVAARPLGIHVEGPFLNRRRRGAHHADWLVEPRPELVDQLLEAAPELVRLVTVAPELRYGLDTVRRLAESGILVSVGHSDGTAAELTAAVDAGARMVTHIFNGQRGLHHREPGIAGRALVEPRLTCGLIADMHHIAPDVCRLIFRAATGRICLVTDAVASAGMPPGEYVLGGQPVVVEPGAPPVRSDGTFAGSTLRLDQAIANVVRIGVDVVDAVDAATRVPADLLRRPDLGRIVTGAVADLAWLGDDLRAKATWIDGDLVYGELPEADPSRFAARPR